MTSLEQLRAWLLAKPGSSASYPFGPGAQVFKVSGKMFALVAENAQPLTVSLKCEPDHALFLRDNFPAVKPGYHLNKKHWNTVTLDSSLPNEAILALIDESYHLVVKGLTRAARAKLNELTAN